MKSAPGVCKKGMKSLGKVDNLELPKKCKTLTQNIMDTSNCTFENGRTDKPGYHEISLSCVIFTSLQ